MANTKLNIPEERQHVFKSVAYMIERKLLDIQMEIAAHRAALRFVVVEYKPVLEKTELDAIEEKLNSVYDLLKVFCNEYSIPKQVINPKSELMIKSNFLWEDICSAISLKGYGHIDEEIVKDYTVKIDHFITAANELIQQIKQMQ